MKCAKSLSHLLIVCGAILLATLCLAFAVFAARTDPEHWFTDKEPVEDFAFSFVVVGDTQNITQGRSHMLHTIFDYIVDNREEKKTAHVFHMGDIATDYVTDEEWQVAAEAIGKMNGLIPYTLTRGNHDAKAQYEKYLFDIKRLLNDGGVLFADDVLLYGWVSGEEPTPHKRQSIVDKIRSYLRVITEDRDFITSVLNVGDGVALSVYQPKKK